MENYYGDATKTLTLNENFDNMLDIRVILGGQDIDWYVNDEFLTRTINWGNATGSDFHRTKAMSLDEFKQIFKQGSNTVSVRNQHQDTWAWMEIKYNIEVRKCPID